MSKSSYHYTTYNYGVLDTNDDDEDNLTHDLDYGKSLGEWVFIY